MPGTYKWIEDMQWTGKDDFNAERRQNIHVSEYSSQAGYKQEASQFAVYTVLRSGHMVGRRPLLQFRTKLYSVTFLNFAI